jgi:branched-chain amino acid transport system ATP-binding protein
VLALDDVRAAYGRNEVLHGVTMTVPAGSITVLLGANGAGKTTTLRTVVGDLTTTAGTVSLDGADVTSHPVAARIAAGIALVPEGGRVWADFTVARNLTLGGFLTRDRDALDRRRDDVFALFPVLAERQEQRAGTLSGGERQMLAIGRALMSEPRLLLLDEPFLGLAPVVIDQVIDVLRRIRDERRVTMVLAEQNTTILDVADQVVGLHLGAVAFTEDEPWRLTTAEGEQRLAETFLGSRLDDTARVARRVGHLR